MNCVKQLAAVALTSAFAGTAVASDAIIFDENGAAAGGQLTVGSFDWTPGTALADGAIPLAPNPANTFFNLYTQASLGRFLDPNGNAITGTGLGTNYEITFVTGFGETGSQAVIPGTGISANFSLDPSASVNFFRVYYDTAKNSNALTGTGYDDGTVILSGLVVSNTTTFFIPFLNNPPVKLDAFGADDYAGTGTLSGVGGGDLKTDVTSQDFDFFKTLISGLAIDLFSNTSNILNFQQTNPSQTVAGVAVNLGGAACAGFSGAGGLGGNNGDIGCGAAPGSDFLFQADANTSFQPTPAPEPSALALVGLGLSIFGLFRNKKRSS